MLKVIVNVMNSLNQLNRKNNQLKSRLLQRQLMNRTYSFEYSKKEMLDVINAYKTHKSIFKAASSVGVDVGLAMKWYNQGSCGNPAFRGFYLAINDINEGIGLDEPIKSDDQIIQNKSFDGDYKISQYGDGWSYTTYVDGEKIFIISNELDGLKEKVRARNLPLE